MSTADEHFRQIQRELHTDRRREQARQRQDRHDRSPARARERQQRERQAAMSEEDYLNSWP
jgi:hypothetical protein